MKNPYRPGVGLQPPYLAGRDDEQATFKRILRGSPEIPGNVRLTGLRGVGKTVLLGKFADIAREENWAVAQVEAQPSHNDDYSLVEFLSTSLGETVSRVSRAARVKSAARDVAQVLRRSTQIEVEGMNFSLGEGEAATPELANLLTLATSKCVGAGKAGLAILIDEAQVITDGTGNRADHPLSTLLAAVSSTQREGQPLVLVLCGLPTLAVNLLNARTYSERMFRGIAVESLAEEAARDAFLKPLEGGTIRADDELVAAVLDEVEGYPYFIQLWGAELWDATNDAALDRLTTSTLGAVREGIYTRLDADFYEPRIQSLTPAEQDILLATSQCNYPPLIVADLNSQSPKSPGNVNVLLGRLVTQNVLYRERKGQYRYTAPGFRAFLQRRAVD